MRNILTSSILLVALAAATLSAQRGMQGGLYDPAKETTMTGTVDAVTTTPAQGRGGGGIHLTLAATSGAIDVHVGPASFVSGKNFTLAKGDVLTVVGSKVTMAGQDVLIAREITKGSQVLTLRDAKGLPLWAGGDR